MMSYQLPAQPSSIIDRRYEHVTLFAYTMPRGPAWQLNASTPRAWAVIQARLSGFVAQIEW